MFANSILLLGVLHKWKLECLNKGNRLQLPIVWFLIPPALFTGKDHWFSCFENASHPPFSPHWARGRGISGGFGKASVADPILQGAFTITQDIIGILVHRVIGLVPIRISVLITEK